MTIGRIEPVSHSLSFHVNYKLPSVSIQYLIKNCWRFLPLHKSLDVTLNEDIVWFLRITNLLLLLYEKQLSILRDVQAFRLTVFC